MSQLIYFYLYFIIQQMELNFHPINFGVFYLTKSINFHQFKAFQSIFKIPISHPLAIELLSKMKILLRLPIKHYELHQI